MNGSLLFDVQNWHVSENSLHFGSQISPQFFNTIIHLRQQKFLFSFCFGMELQKHPLLSIAADLQTARILGVL